MKLNNYLIQAKRALYRLLSFLPSALPVGMTQFQVWADKIIFAYNLPDNDSSRFALATMILHAASTDAYKPKRYFGLCALKSMSNQIAGGVLQDLKQKQQERIAAEAGKNPAGTVS